LGPDRKRPIGISFDSTRSKRWPAGLTDDGRLGEAIHAASLPSTRALCADTAQATLIPPPPFLRFILPKATSLRPCGCIRTTAICLQAQLGLEPAPGLHDLVRAPPRLVTPPVMVPSRRVQISQRTKPNWPTDYRAWMEAVLEAGSGPSSAHPDVSGGIERTSVAHRCRRSGRGGSNLAARGSPR